MQGILTRDRAYKVLAGRAVIGQGLGTLAGIAAAMAGAGAWALVLQQCVTSLAGALSLIVRATWKPRLVMRWAAIRALLRTGLPLAASTLVQQSRYRVFAVLIGGTAGPAALGVVHLAFRLVDTVRDLALTALWRLMLPADVGAPGRSRRAAGQRGPLRLPRRPRHVPGGRRHARHGPAAGAARARPGLGAGRPGRRAAAAADGLGVPGFRWRRRHYREGRRALQHGGADRRHQRDHPGRARAAPGDPAGGRVRLVRRPASRQPLYDDQDGADHARGIVPAVSCRIARTGARLHRDAAPRCPCRQRSGRCRRSG